MTIPDDPPGIDTGIKKLELGYDLDKDHTGNVGGIAMTTAQSEFISNFMENGDYLTTKDPPTK